MTLINSTVNALGDLQYIHLEIRVSKRVLPEGLRFCSTVGVPQYESFGDIGLGLAFLRCIRGRRKGFINKSNSESKNPFLRKRFFKGSSYEMILTLLSGKDVSMVFVRRLVIQKKPFPQKKSSSRFVLRQKNNYFNKNNLYWKERVKQGNKLHCNPLVAESSLGGKR